MIEEVEFLTSEDDDNIYFEGYTLKERIGLQTLNMELQLVEETFDTRYLGIYMTLYNKRSQIEDNENQVKSTGLSPIKTYFIAKKMLISLIKCAIEQEQLKEKDIVIFCTWLDNRRREVYYKVLSKMGFIYGKHILTKEKVLMRKFKKGESL